jgi:hypothetical protein
MAKALLEQSKGRKKDCLRGQKSKGEKEKLKLLHSFSPLTS